MTEPICSYCGASDKFRCRTQEDAENCPSCPITAKAPLIQSGPLAGLRRGHYKAIYADPAWTFDTRSDDGKGRSPERHYDCMTLDEIKALPVGELAAPDCALFMWVIDTHLPQAMEVLDAWGFEFKTRAFCWAKRNKKGPGFFTGMGYWTRANPEDCWLAVKGAPKRIDKSVRRLVVQRRREHSRKPDRIYGDIERLVAGPYVELFSRSGRAGWDVMGNEAGKFGEVESDLI